MIQQHYRDGAWTAPRIVQTRDLTLSPLTKSLHYGQAIFEGLKAHRQVDGGVALFRPHCHLERLNRSADRLCVPRVDIPTLLQAIERLVALEQDLTPDPPGSLYVRPLIFADEVGLRPSVAESYTLIVLVLPVEHYFQNGAGLRLTTETEFVRAVRGGTGMAKCAGNYAAALHATREANRRGFDEVLWLDATERRYIEESGSMNIMLVRRGVLMTPELTGSILPGITRETLLTLAQEMGYETCQCAISVDPSDWVDVTEVFSSGTAAGVTPVASIDHNGEILFESNVGLGPVGAKLGGALCDAKEGRGNARWCHSCSRERWADAS